MTTRRKLHKNWWILVVIAAIALLLIIFKVDDSTPSQALEKSTQMATEQIEKQQEDINKMEVIKEENKEKISEVLDSNNK